MLEDRTEKYVAREGQQQGASRNFPWHPAKSPQTNGICERFHKTVLNEFYRVTFRKKIYRSLDELQTDLDTWLKLYNQNRPHQGRWCYGKTPMQTFIDSIPWRKRR
jgi:Integrase core domain